MGVKHERRVKWIAALRSGVYTQGRGTLKRYQPHTILHEEEILHCVWGVGAEVAHLEDQKFVTHSGLDYFMYVNSNGVRLTAGSTPPDVLLDWYGIPQRHAQDFIFMNDGGREFWELANRIEDQDKEGLFED